MQVAVVPWLTAGQAEEGLEFNVLEPGEDPERPAGWFLGLRNQGGFWRFWRRGTRLTFELLIDYAAALGHQPFEEAFYAPCETTGALFVACGPLPAR